MAGGGLSICSSSFQPGENCWFSDSCNYVINSYDELYDVKPMDPVQCANNTTNPHYMEKDGFYEDWETWTTYCPRDQHGEPAAPVPGPWDDV